MNLDEEFEVAIAQAKDLHALSLVLEELLTRGHGVWTDGHLYLTKKFVDRIGRLKIEINHNEHPPPHFHVRHADLNASFTIAECRHLAGPITGTDEKLVRWWHERSRPALIKIWNETRPGGCPVGRIAEQ
jgi:hypothetical protein